MITPADVAHMLSHGGREHARGASEEDTLLYTSQTVITSDQEQITTVSFVKTTVRSFKRGNQADEKTQLHNEETSDNASNKEVHGASNVDSQQSENMQYGEHNDTPKTDEAKQQSKKKLVVPKPSQLAVPFAAKIARNTEQEESEQTAAPKSTTLKPATSSRMFIPKPSDMAESLAAMTPILSRDGVEKMECRNLLHTEEACLEWHVWYRDTAGELWQLDIIHIRKGSQYDGFVEDFGDRLQAALTEETRAAILHLKAQTPEHEQTAGIFYYLAVLRDGIRTYEDFCRWRRNLPSESIVTWRP